MSDVTMTCQAVHDQLALLLYGELSFDEEERIDQHLDSCVPCHAALDRQRALHAAVDDLAVAPSPSLLASCRDSLFDTLDLQTADPQFKPLRVEERMPKRESWWSQFVGSFEGLTTHWLRPAGAVALLAIGFMAARMVPAWGPM